MTAQFSSQFSGPKSGSHGSSLSKRPITAHPLFPKGMGVWFAVLFSLSSLAVRGSLLEALVVITHIDYLFPAASPPLGAIPRAIMALLIAALGYHIGRKVGLRIAQSEADAHRAVAEPVYGVPPHADYGHDYGHPEDAAPRRPFQVHEEVGGHYGVDPYYAADPAAGVAGAWVHDASGYNQAPYQAAYAQGAQAFEPGPQAGYPAAEQAGRPSAYPAEPQPQPHSAFAEAWQPPHPAGPEAFGQAGGGYYAPAHHVEAPGAVPAQGWPADQWPPASHQPASPQHDYAFVQERPEPMAAVDPAWNGQNEILGDSHLTPTADAAPVPGYVPPPWPPAHDGFVAPTARPQGVDWPQADAKPPFAPAASPVANPVAPVAEPVLASEPAPEAAPMNGAARIAEGSLEKLSNVELMERLAIAMQRREDNQPSGGELPPAALELAQDSATHVRANIRANVRASTGTGMPAARSALAALRGLK